MGAYRQYRAPSEDGAALVDPSWREQLDRLAQPPTPADISLGGASLKALAPAARAQLLADAKRHTSQYADVATPPSGPVVVSGHQPELFHPGVWFKNFALDSLAKASGGVGVHLLVDSDLCRGASVRTPTGPLDEPRLTPVPYDAVGASTPYEERRLLDRAAFESFPGRVKQTLGPLVESPLVGELWSLAREALGRTDRLASLLSEPRHQLERSWGSTTLELPMSAVCDAEGFRRLAAELLLRPEDTQGAYNAALDAYRAAHNLKNAAQPLPDLKRDDGWLEMPLWVWSEAAPTHAPLYARRDENTLALTDRAGWSAEGPADADGVVGWLGELRSAGVKVRSRALVTTFYSRLVLADLFLHGIGGAKYDQVTDRFAEKLLGVAPPSHATLTATLRLPIDHGAPTEGDRRAALKRLRDLRYHPERFAPEHEAAAIKQRWVATAKTPDNATERHQAITSANRAMADSLAAERAETERRLASIEEGLRAAAVLDSREHSFCLFPVGSLRERLRRLASTSS